MGAVSSFAGILRAVPRFALHAARAPRLMWRRYVLKQPAVGCIPGEVKLHERYWERRLAADTGGWVTVTLDDGTLYEATPYLLLLEVMRHLDLGPQDLLVDLGCGKGRALAMAAQNSRCRITGVEQDADFLAAARRNLAALGDRGARVQLHHGLAQSFDFDASTVIFMFNPFGARTLQEVLPLLQASLARNPRRLRLVYAHPVHDQLLQGTPWLANTSIWDSGAYPEIRFLPPIPRLVSFWQNR